MFPTIIIFIIILGLLILVHELGHFLAARRMGVRVDEFGFGFPPRVLSVKRGETRYSLNLIPFGGFVKIYGEQGEGVGEENSFVSKKIRQRAFIIAAGVLMNFALAALLLGIGYKIGLPTAAEAEAQNGGAKISKVQIAGIAPGSPAESANIQIGDRVVSAQTKDQAERIDVYTAENLQTFVEDHKGSEIILMLQRGKQIFEVQIVPRESHPEEEGPLGVALANITIVSYPLFQAFVKGITDTINLTILIISALGMIIYKAIIGLPVGEVVSGPVGIYNLTSQAAEMGFTYLLQLTVLLSINLGIINILPFPALDGGRLIFLGVERIKGSPVSQKVEGMIHTVGFALLILLMILVTYKDLTKLF